DIEFLSDTTESFDSEFEILARMCCRNLDADPRLAFGHNRVGKANDVNSMNKHRVGKPGRQSGVAEHHRHDRMSSRNDLKATLTQLSAKDFVFLLHLYAKGGEPRQILEHLK